MNRTDQGSVNTPEGVDRAVHIAQHTRIYGPYGRVGQHTRKHESSY